jgi:hypothetical protein
VGGDENDAIRLAGNGAEHVRQVVLGQRLLGETIAFAAGALEEAHELRAALGIAAVRTGEALLDHVARYGARIRGE